MYIYIHIYTYIYIIQIFPQNTLIYSIFHFKNVLLILKHVKALILYTLSTTPTTAVNRPNQCA